jgi:hypothetical protein
MIQIHDSVEKFKALDFYVPMLYSILILWLFSMLFLIKTLRQAS